MARVFIGVIGHFHRFKSFRPAHYFTHALFPDLSYQERRGLVNQPNSLDDLDDADGIPFDSVPVRYDAGK